MRNRNRRRWVTLVALPLVVALGMWPVAQRRRQRMEAQETTRVLLSAMVQVDPLSSRYLQPTIVQRLINRGANVNMRIRHSPLLNYVVCPPLYPDNKHSHLEQISLVHLMLTHGADTNAHDLSGKTPLMYAAMYAEPEVARMLLDKGAQVDLRQREGYISRTALTFAKDHLQELQALWSSERSAWTPQTSQNIALQLRDATRIIAMLKAAGAHQ